MELEGKVKVIFDAQTFDSGFKKREFVITTESQYPQEVVFQLVNDKCDELNTVNVGDNMKVHFDVRGREYNGRYFVNLQAWRLEKAGAAQAAPPMDTMEPVASNDDDGDLPF